MPAKPEGVRVAGQRPVVADDASSTRDGDDRGQQRSRSAAGHRGRRRPGKRSPLLGLDVPESSRRRKATPIPLMQGHRGQQDRVGVRRQEPDTATCMPRKMTLRIATGTQKCGVILSSRPASIAPQYAADHSHREGAADRARRCGGSSRRAGGAD